MRQPSPPRTPRPAPPRPRVSGATPATGPDAGTGVGRGAGPDPRERDGRSGQRNVVTPARAPRGADLVIPADELEDFELDGEWDELDEDGYGELEEVGPAGRTPGARVSQLDARLAERRRSSRRVLWIRLGAAAGAVALVALVIWIVGFSSVLGLRADQVTIEGEGPYLDRDAAIAEVTPHVGTPLARLDTASIAAAIAQAPGIEAAEVARDWPNGVVLTLTPRAPVAVADTGGEQVDLVGADGVVVASVGPDAVPEGLPLLTVDMDQDGAQETVLAVLSVLDQLPPELREQVRDAGAASRDAIELQLHSGAHVVWGSAGESRLKAEVLLALLQQPAERYDVSAPEAPTTS